MILQLDNGQKFDVRFTHHLDSPVPHTEVQIANCEWDSTSYLLGAGLCHPNDQFNKAIGRKVALARAISGLPRETRTQIWKAYFAFLKRTPQGI